MLFQFGVISLDILHESVKKWEIKLVNQILWGEGI